MRQIDIHQFKADREDGKVLAFYDVREANEYAEVRVPGAVLLPLSELAQRVHELDDKKGTPIYLICRSGGRSARAAMFLDSLGHTTINVGGGTMGWMSAGYDIEP